MFIKCRRLAAFTLLECLVALVVISGGLLLFQAMSQYVSQQVVFLTQDKEEDWLIFAQQLQAEFSESQLDHVSGDKVYLKKSGQDLAISLSKSGDIRKTNAQGKGYQPMLFDVSSFKVSQEGQRVWIILQQKRGPERRLCYDF
ncbi:competence type IV pilus minor pilin ComGF [Streptococcus sp. DD12]|uniref:competence type IV pilus minor pilin ComGF n=1 Tax=Streptococcus sp. DD12 TaxID=1777880 RepID=UPI00079C4660|nr:competence type IV pilus minor pilin ComGF [Streptococcus sp. DD12]KXT75388.1 Late competence protein ComGF, access of DNA to ComEA [Streptococcus sp. DD12]